MELPSVERLELLLRHCLEGTAAKGDGSPRAVHGVGVDVVDLTRLERLVARPGRRFMNRWFSSEELSQCAQTSDEAQEVGLRFAAKEAIWKAVRLDRWSGAVPWQMISVLREVDAVESNVSLSGVVAKLSHDLGVRRICVTCDSFRTVGIAVALAMR